MEKNVEKEWNELLLLLNEKFGNVDSLTNVLYLIGVQDLGKGFQAFTRQEKMQLIHIGGCRLLSRWDYYLLKGHDENYWPQWQMNPQQPLPGHHKREQLMKESAILYFQENM
jgi:hypothetical protein